VGVDSDLYLSAPGIQGEYLRSIEGGTALDVGCGPGNLSLALSHQATTTLAVDLSEVSLRLAVDRARRSRAPLCPMHADALALPLPDASVDHVVATGSLHHTGNARAGFAEVCRVLRPGGRVLLALYRAGGYYQHLYQSVGRVARWCGRNQVADRVVNRGVLRPGFWAYLVAGRTVAHRRLALPSRAQVRNYFADQLLNPVVSFHTTGEVASWARENGVDVVATATGHAGALLQAVVRKPLPASHDVEPGALRP
jgi:SAM-dependent methyltransferase